MLEALTRRVGGAICLPGDPGYEEARQVWNGMIDRRPVAVVRAATAGDIGAVIEFAREAGLPLAVRGGGHGVAGNGTVDGGIVLDLGSLSLVTVDPESPHGPGRARRHHRRRRRRHLRPRPRGAARRRLDDRRRRADPRRRRRLAHPGPRAEHRQPRRRGRRHRRRRDAARERRGEPRPLLGHPRRRRQLRRRLLLHVPGAPNPATRCSPAPSSTARRAGWTPCWPGRCGPGTCPTPCSPSSASSCRRPAGSSAAPR